MHVKQLIVNCISILFVVLLVYDAITDWLMNRHIIVYIQDAGHWYTKKFGPELVLGF